MGPRVNRREETGGPKQEDEGQRKGEVRDRNASQEDGDMKVAERNHGETPSAFGEEDSVEVVRESARGMGNRGQGKSG